MLTPAWLGFVEGPVCRLGKPSTVVAVRTTEVEAVAVCLSETFNLVAAELISVVVVVT